MVSLLELVFNFDAHYEFDRLPNISSRRSSDALSMAVHRLYSLPISSRWLLVSLITTVVFALHLSFFGLSSRNLEAGRAILALSTINNSDD